VAHDGRSTSPPAGAPAWRGSRARAASAAPVPVGQCGRWPDGGPARNARRSK
jgi:hypothetical protein